MQHRVIDGSDWIERRLAHLQDELTRDLPEDERRAVEGEIEALTKEGGFSCGGDRHLWVRRRLRTIPNS